MNQNNESMPESARHGDILNENQQPNHTTCEDKTANDTLIHALAYAALGWPVLPIYGIKEGKCACNKSDCKSSGKHPMLVHGVKDATTESTVISQWFKRWPVANVGIVTGAISKLYVMDIDPKNGGNDSLDKIIEQHGKIPDDVLQITGSQGRHYCFKYPGTVGRSTTGLWPGIDTRGDGGYIVAAPSLHVSGQRYFWDDQEANQLKPSDLPDAPKWLLKKLAEKPLAVVQTNVGVVTLPPTEVKRIRGALVYISAEDRDQWARVGMALHSTDAGNQAFGIWCEWSQQSEKFNLKDSRRVWDSFKPGGGVTLAAVFALAKQAGWVSSSPIPPRTPPALSVVPAADTSEKLAPDNDNDPLLNPPPEMAAAGYHGIIHEIVEAATKTSEASKVAVAANFIGMFSAMVGRSAFQSIGDGGCHCRPYFLLVGRTGKARKGTSEFTVRRIFSAVEDVLKDDYPAMQQHSGGLSTGEGLGYAIRDLVIDDKGSNGGTDDKRLYITEAEFAGAMAAAAREKNTLSATVRTAWDGRDISPLTKNQMWCASNPHIVISGHITSAELIAKMSDVDAFSGFLNRFVILHIVRPKKVALPARTPDNIVSDIAARVADSVRFAAGADVTGNNLVEVKLADAAMGLWRIEYDKLTDEEDGIAGALLVRTEIYARMLAMIFALLDKSATVEPVHIKAALAWVNYWRDSVRYIFATLAEKAATARLNESSQEVLAFIRKNPKCYKHAITNEFKNRMSADVITAALNHLMNAAPPLVYQKTVPRADGKGGRQPVIFWAK